MIRLGVFGLSYGFVQVELTVESFNEFEQVWWFGLRLEVTDECFLGGVEQWCSFVGFFSGCTLVFHGGRGWGAIMSGLIAVELPWLVCLVNGWFF